MTCQLIIDSPLDVSPSVRQQIPVLVSLTGGSLRKDWASWNSATSVSRSNCPSNGNKPTKERRRRQRVDVTCSCPHFAFPRILKYIYECLLTPSFIRGPTRHRLFNRASLLQFALTGRKFCNRGITAMSKTSGRHCALVHRLQHFPSYNLILL